MYLTSLKPNWRHLHGLKNNPFIHFNLQTLGLNYYIPYDFTRSFNHLPPDNYVSNNDPVTRSRRYANIKVDVTDNYKYSLSYTKNDIFQQKVDDNRGVKRQFELIDHYHINQVWMLDFLTQISALSVLNHNYYSIYPTDATLLMEYFSIRVSISLYILHQCQIFYSESMD